MRRSLAVAIFFLAVLQFAALDTALSMEQLVIATSPSVKSAVEELGRAYETKHPDVQVRVYLDNGLDMRRTIAAMENSMVGQYFIGSGPIHLIAPGGDELITRLQQKYYVLPGSKTTYGEARLVLVVPESLSEAPTSFEALVQNGMRLAVADPVLTELGRMTRSFLDAKGLSKALKGRLDMGSDARGVLDHLLSGQADAGVLLSSDAYEQRDRIRVIAVAEEAGYTAPVHSMAMERYCPNRNLCSDFLRFIVTPEAAAILKRVGLHSPS